MEEFKDFGVCPVCGKGHIKESSVGYSCNYFKSVDDKCSFTIHHTYWGKHITEDIVKQLIENGETEVFNDFVNQKGMTFSASLKIEDEVVKPHFINRTLMSPCPKCGGKIEVLLSGYACENYKKDEAGSQSCNVFIAKSIADKEIPEFAVELLLTYGSTPFFDDFKKKTGETFSAGLTFNPDYNVVFTNNVCKCPKCGGNVYVGKKAYNCSNYMDPNIKCDFVIWKEMSGRKITPNEVAELCLNRYTSTLSGFHSKNGEPFDGKLIISDNFKVLIK